MVERQIAGRGIDDPRVLAAFRSVPRERFVSRDYVDVAHDDRPLPIGAGQTISQPYIVARMIVAAQVGARDRVLEVGGGSGYAAAVLAQLAERVWSIERHAELARLAAARIAELGYANCSVLAGDGTEGLPAQAPFDAILVAACGDAIPDALRLQLAPGGRLVMPVGDGTFQLLKRLSRDGDDSWSEAELEPVRFVPLLSDTQP